MMKIGDFVKAYRKEHGLSMQAFGEKCGLSRAYISMLESGRNPTTNESFSPRLETLEKIAKAMNMTMEEFIDIFNPASEPLARAGSYNRSVTPPSAYKPYLDERFRLISILGSMKPGPKGVSLSDYMGAIPIDASIPGHIEALVVKDDNMKNLIAKDDLVFVRLQSDVENGRIAVVSLNGAIGTLKRVEKFSDGFVLLSANPDCEPVVVTGAALDSFKILGEVIGKVHWGPVG